MNLDLVVLGIVLFSAVWGAWKGFARQVAQTAGALLAWLAASPAGAFFGPMAAAKLATSLTVGIVLSTIAAFLLVYLVAQIIITAVIKRVLAGRDPSSTSADRMLGFALGGAKMAAITFAVICGATFLESNVSVSGKRLTFTPKDSVVVKLARQWNVFEHWQFSGAKDFVRVAKMLGTPADAARIKDDPDLASLNRDPRFRKALGADGLKKAMETGDVHALLGNGAVMELLQDAELSRRLERLAERSVQ